MSKFAPVAPVHIYQAMLDTKDPTIIGDYFLLLAHDVLANAKAYEEVFSQPELKDATIIMDNSVVELGDAVSAKTLYEAADIVKATCIAIPDVLKEGDATLNRAHEFFEEVGRLQKAHQELMFIPQGSNMQDFYECMREAVAQEFPMQWIGIPRNTTKRITTSRKFLVDMCHEFSPKSKIHLLGFSEDQADDVATVVERPKLVSGIDSAAPLRIRGVVQNPPQDPGDRGQWWESVTYRTQIGYNIRHMRAILQNEEFVPTPEEQLLFDGITGRL